RSQRLPSLPCAHNELATAENYTLSLHDALPIFQPPRTETTSGIEAEVALHGLDVQPRHVGQAESGPIGAETHIGTRHMTRGQGRSEEHTSELQSRENLVCRLLLEKKKEERTTRK